MTRSRNIILMTTIALGTTLIFSGAANAGGCHRGGGGHRGGGFHHHHVRPSYSYSTPSYGSYRPSYPSSQPSFPQSFPQQQPNSGPPQGFSQPATGGSQFAGVPQTTAPAGNPAVSQQPQPSQPQQNSVAQPGTATQGTSTNAAESSALQALGAFAPPATANETVGQQAAHVGTWSANLSDGARVQLELQADGRFRWAATKKSGNASSFEGTYSVGGGSLTLIRTQDNQKLAGSMNVNGNNAFQFKLTGTRNAAALKFTRS